MKKSIFAAGLAAAATLSMSTVAHAADVTVRVEGNSAILPPTVASAAAFSKVPDGESAPRDCAADSPISALNAATKGNWSGPFYDFYGFSPQTILGESHTLASNTSFWSFYVNTQYYDDPNGTCTTNLKAGDEVLFYLSKNGSSPDGYEEPLKAVAPRTAAPGTPFTVTVQEAVTSFEADGFTVKEKGLPASAGATVAGGGATATTGADGKATITVTQRGPVELKTTKGRRAPDRDLVCVTDGADGFCGTTKPGEPASTTTAPTPAPAPEPVCLTTGTDGKCGSPDKLPAFGSITSLKEGQTFRAGKGPRTLAGKVAEDGAGVRRVTLRLTRNDRGRCGYFSGRREVWVKTKRCSALAGFFFKAAETEDWSYLLPEQLPRGRYVLDARATDKAGNADLKLDRGRNRIVFRVG